MSRIKKSKKIALATILAFLAAFGYILKDYSIIYAQSLPATKTFAWDANAASDAVTNYTVRLDGTVIGNPTGTTQQFTVTTSGTHVLTVTATNIWGTSPASTHNFIVVIPSSPSNTRIQ